MTNIPLKVNRKVVRWGGLFLEDFMTIRSINLRKLLQFCALDERQTLSALRKESYQDRRRAERLQEGGGDFFAPFWSDAKSFVTHGLNLHEATDDRIIKNRLRARLYPILKDGFLQWWEAQLRGTNQLLVPLEDSIHARIRLDNLDITVKVDNLLSLQVGQHYHRLVYPYFCEHPVLSGQWARVGLWTMTRALPHIDPQEMHILDVQRARSFSLLQHPFKGNEEDILTLRCEQLLQIWHEIEADAP
jgi:hypothetical protein